MPAPTQKEQAKMLCDYATELHGAKRFQTGEVAARRALRLDPKSSEGHNALGAMLMNLGRYSEALDHLTTARLLAPKSSAAWGNLGLTLSAMKNWERSERAFNRGLDVSPGDVGLLWNRANMFLDSGNWERGLAEYEVRIQHRGPPNYPKMPYKMWGGESLDGKTIFIQAEQGIGDRILASRYLVWLKSSFPTARILYMSNHNLHSLMWDFRDVVEFVPEGIPWPQADYGLFEMSLIGLHAKMTTPPNDTFTPERVLPEPGRILSRAQRDRASVNLPEPHHSSLKVGICWTGNPGMDRNWERSLPLEQLLPLAALPDVTLYSLQVNNGDILRLGANQIVCDLGPEIASNLSRTAAVMLNLDLVITVCTSVAHLAGALGVPTWVMLCQNPYWVWLNGRDTSVWYPSVKLFRQQSPGEWGPVVDDVKRQLEALARETLHLDRKCA